MKNNNFVFGLPVMTVILALALTGCETGTGGDTETGHDTETGGDSGAGTNVLVYAVSVQEKIDNNTTVTKNTGTTSSGKLVSAAYNTDTGNYTLLYKIGRINNLFSHYVTGGIPGGKGYGLTYTTNVNTVSSTSLNTTVSESISVGDEVGFDAKVVVKSSRECTAGVSVSETKTIEQAIGNGAAYSYSFEKLESDKLYAFAMFSMMDFYQIFTYNPDNGMAAPILDDEKPLVYYNILDMFNYQICEYIPVNEIEFKTLEAWGHSSLTFQMRTMQN